MLDYLSTLNAMHVRTINVSLQDYIFVLQVVLGERPELAYANVFDTQEFNRNIGTEQEEEYLETHKKDAETLLCQQSCIQLRDYLKEEYQSEVQAAASNLEDFNYTGADVKKLISNLLRNRSESLDDASVRDILSLVKSLFDSGYLDSDDAWAKHFITIPRKYNALCISCNREINAVEGLDIKCPYCGQIYKWEGTRFYPQMMKL